MDYDVDREEEEELSDVEESDSNVESEHNSDDSEVDDSDHEQPWYWQIIIDEADERHEEERKEIVENLTANGETETDAKQAAYEKILPRLRKELRKILTEKLEWMQAMKQDSYFKKIMKTRKELLDTGDYDWLEATKLALHQRKFLLNDLIPSEYVDKDNEENTDVE
jgi:hypothetical protein